MAQYLNLKPIDFDNLSAKLQAKVEWEGRILLPKYDGCLALIYFKQGVCYAISSRDDKPVKSMGHIPAMLLKVYPWIAGCHNVCIIGEAWTPGRPFKEISGMFRRHSQQDDLGFAPFDVVGVTPENVLESALPYAQRLARLARRYTTTDTSVFKPDPVICGDRQHAERFALSLKNNGGGYDGAIASDPGAPYVVSNGKGEFLKVKPLQSFSLEVLRLDVGVGEKTGKATGALVVRFKSGECGVGTGFDAGTLAGWISNPSSIVGKIIEVACMGVYDGPDGMMREPRYVGIRDDVNKADY